MRKGATLVSMLLVVASGAATADPPTGVTPTLIGRGTYEAFDGEIASITNVGFWAA